MTESTAGKKDTQRLQRAIVEGLEDVKAQDIRVFNTEHLSPLFERVIVASGTSNRQTKALAASVRDAVREAGFGKPRIEGEDNGEWIIVDCGAAVAHIMQPAIRTYYQLEDIWGDKPVRLKLGSPKPMVPTKPVAAAPAPTAAAKKRAAAGPLLRRSSAAKTAQRAADAAASKPASPKKAASGKAGVKVGAKPAGKAQPQSSARAIPKTGPKATPKTAVKAATQGASKAPAKPAPKAAGKPPRRAA
jgi:ribosome-associated protein